LRNHAAAAAIADRGTEIDARATDSTLAEGRSVQELI
jgi:hypothetical protein